MKGLFFQKKWLLIVMLFSSFLQAGQEEDEICVFCRDFVLPIAQDVAVNTMMIVGAWAASKFTLKEFKKGRLPGQIEKPKKSSELEKRLDKLEKENAFLSRAVVCLVAAGTETEDHKEIVRKLWAHQPGKEEVFAHARDQDRLKIERTLKGQ